MASCITTQWSGNYTPQARLTVTQTSETATQAVLAWTLEYVAHGYAASTNNTSRAYTVKINGSVPSEGSGSFNIHGITGTKTVASGSVTINKTTGQQSIPFSVSFTFNLTWSGVYKGTLSASSSISVKAKTSYTVSYNANGGSGAPATQTKWHDTSLTLSSIKPTRAGYSFQGWALTKADADTGTWYYSAGSTCGKNENLTLYAVWKPNTYAVTYYANASGVSNVPGAQTKTYGVNLPLDSAVPTKTDYVFVEWNTKSNGTGTAYKPGDTYKGNAALPLYAIWKLDYEAPRISRLTVARCNSLGTEEENVDLDDNKNDTYGTYAHVNLAAAWDRVPATITIAWSSATAESGSTSWTVDASSLDSDGIIFGNGTLDPDSVYTVVVTVADSGGSLSLTRPLPATIFPIDFLPDPAGGVGIGKAAKKPGVMDVGFTANFDGPVQGKVYGLDKLVGITSNTDLNTVLTPGAYSIAAHVTAATLKNGPSAFIPPSAGAGRLIVATASGEPGGKNTWSYIHQEYIPLNPEFPVCKRLVSNNASGVMSFGEWLPTSINGGRVLWSGSHFMSANQTATLSSPVSQQPNGIVLVWSVYDNSSDAAENSGFNSFFIPRQLVLAHPGVGHSCFMGGWGSMQIFAHKYVYINDDTIRGNAYNEGTQTGAIALNNSRFVLRYVIGV